VGWLCIGGFVLALLLLGAGSTWGEESWLDVDIGVFWLTIALEWATFWAVVGLLVYAVSALVTVMSRQRASTREGDR
jgi:hypothetical protein